MDNKLKEKIAMLSQKLQNADTSSISTVIGFDGFVDNIIKVVDKRADAKNFTAIDTIEAYGNKILAAKGLSANIELFTTKSKLGGNGPIFANALIEYGVDVTYIGLLGENGIHSVFQDMASRCKTYSIADPSVTDALEFTDGKLMMGKHMTLADVNWENLCNKLGGPHGIAKIFDNATLIGMENWTMLIYMSDIWEHYIEEVFPLLTDKEVKPFAFFDLADPEKRTNSDIKKAMNIIGRFSDKYRPILGLNEKEAYEIGEVLDITVDDSLDGIDKLKDVTKKIYDKMNLYCLVVHPTKEAIACCYGEILHAEGAFCKAPKLTTGAGDNFNGGFCLGQSLGLSVELSLLLGTSTSGYYVRNAKSPTMQELIEYLNLWKDGKLD